MKPKKRHPDYDRHSTSGPFKMVRIDGKMTVQRIEQLTWSERRSRFEKTRPKPIDLRVLNGSPNLIELKLENNHAPFLFPSKCPKLEVVFLSEFSCKGDCLDECPNLLLVKLERSGSELDFGHFLDQYKTSKNSPIIFIKTAHDDIPLEYYIVNFKKLPQKIKDNFVTESVDKQWMRYESLNRIFEVDIATRDKPRMSE
jgi:hypothetical protein